MHAPTMKVEIWSDVMCPFCYIGKRKFEAALAQFPEAASVELIWKSFQLDPDLETNPGANIYQYLADRKGMSYARSLEMHTHVTQLAAEVGLDYRFDKAVIANSFDAHRLSHLAKKYGKGNELEELLFKGYFTEGKNIADPETLVQLGIAVGLNEPEIHEMLAGEMFATDVKQDMVEAQQVGVRGVPFFVFNRRYAVSGAQPTDVFLETLHKSFAEWRKDNPEIPLEVVDGAVCTPDGECS